MRKTALRRVSKKRAKEARTYTKLRKIFLQEHPFCQVRVGPYCNEIATEIHHKEKRGKNYLNVDTFLAACFNCHRWIHDHPKEARERRFLV